MSASILSMKCLRRCGGLWSYCRITCLRYQQKRFLQEKIALPEADFEKDNKGRLIAPVIRPLPKGVDLDPEMIKECRNDPQRYPKHHAGLMHPDKVPHLPKLMVKNARQLLAEKDLISNALLKESMNRLKEIYSKRQPPIDRRIIAAKTEAIEEEMFTAYIEKRNINFEELKDDEKDRLKRKVQNMATRTCKATTHNWKPIEYKDYAGLVYMASRLTLNYTVLYRIFYEINKLDKDFSPHAVLNVGSGTGSAVWAANKIWADEVYEYYNVDTSTYMNDLARKLLSKDIRNPLELVMNGVNFRQSLPSPKHKENKFPLVVSAYLLLEQPSMEERLNLISLLWDLTDNYLVLVEHGTTAGYQLILEAREMIFKLRAEYPEIEGHVFSPCTHEKVCPKLQLWKSPCTFSIEYRRLNIDEEFGQGDSKLLERYSYVVLKKGKKKEDKRFPRLTGVLHKTNHSHCHLCCPDGTLRQFVFTEQKPSRNLFKCIKRCSPGDFIPMPWPETDVDNDSENITTDNSENITSDNSENITTENSENIDYIEQNTDKEEVENDENVDDNLK
ncbi:methyltransferase-like protein 17, mitochondrial [Ruditapes philippinarum]|uniref:methyltransferase-like protein 17, mitochondrial n=1 Tax=Ruditapes philippinarum TaxID=129788 RepID=UPI00295B7761|nr:methyltransferase-like protein 17, mitochondrial [Ruditapes philippinarum]